MYNIRIRSVLRKIHVLHYYLSKILWVFILDLRGKMCVPYKYKYVYNMIWYEHLNSMNINENCLEAKLSSRGNFIAWQLFAFNLFEGCSFYFYFILHSRMSTTYVQTTQRTHAPATQTQVYKYKNSSYTRTHTGICKYWIIAPVECRKRERQRCSYVHKFPME